MDSHRRPPIWRSPVGIVLLVASAVGAYFLLTGHFDHLLQALPYLLLLACPLMHLFHRGHHHRHGHAPHESPPGPDEPTRR